MRGTIGSDRTVADGNVRVRDAQSKQVAIVGIGCRLPGGIEGPQQLAEFLRSHGDAIVDVPPDRWNADLYYHPDPEAPGKTYVRRGGFLQHDVFAFDPEPFGISPREADQLDPQQRLLLEVSWEALEDAGIALEQLRGSQTGVFVGGFTLDYQSLTHAPDNQRLLSAHSAVGASMTLLSNRISYTFDLRGPSMTVDTACSSSLVATHMAREAILRGECDLALVGGVTVMLSPATTIAMSKGHFLSPDGRSKTFEAGADGYGRGEGAGVVALKRLDLAQRDGDRIYAVLCASGVGQDGRTDGIPLPSRAAQHELGARVLSASGFGVNDVQYVEAHGTGTRAGDQAETGALGDVYSEGRESPLLVGSIKSNIGHLEAAAGIVGLIKATLSVHHREIFPLRALNTPNPDIPFEALKLQPALRGQPWPTKARAVAAVNAFGYGGTNANVVIAEPEPAVSRPRLVPLSAATPEALAQRAQQLSQVIDRDAFDDQCHTLAVRRSHLPERAVLRARSAPELVEELRALAEGVPSETLALGRAAQERKLLWVFTGMGPQWWGMGQQLLECEPVFREACEAADAAFEAAAGWSILSEMRQPEAASRMASNAIAQPSNFVLQVGLTALLRDYGVPAHGMLGHSVGELGAAWASGCLTLEQAATAAFHRSRLQQRVAGQGTMLATALSEAEARRLIGQRKDVSIAAINAPRSVTLAGAHAALAELAATLEARGVFNRTMRVEIAYHSVQMDPLHDGFLDALQHLTPAAPELPLYSTALGERLTTARHDAEYWWRNARDPVLLQTALGLAIDDGYNAFLEVGPHPVLSAAVSEVLRDRESEGKSFFCLKRKQPEQARMLDLTSELYVNGIAIDWSAHHPSGQRVDLPSYPFQRVRHFVEAEAARATRLGAASAHGYFSALEQEPRPRFVSDLARPQLSYLADHRVQGAVVFPAAGTVDAALCALRELEPAASELVVEDLRLGRALVFQPHAAPKLMLELTRETGDFAVFARQGDEAWERYSGGRLLLSGRYAPPPALDVDALRAALDAPVDLEQAYSRLERMGLAYGPEFRRLETLDVGRLGEEDCLLARLRTEDLSPDQGSMHPCLLDAAFHGVLAAVPGLSRAMLPVAIDRVRLASPGCTPSLAFARWRAVDDDAVLADVTLATDEGEVVLEVVGLRCTLLEQGAGAQAATSDLLYFDTFEPTELPAAAQPRGQVWLLGGTALGYLATLGESLEAVGIATCPLDEADPREPYTKAVVAFDTDDSDPVGMQACGAFARAVAQLRGTECALRLITFGARQLGGAEARPAQNALLGMARVVMTEHPELALRCVDVAADPPQPGDALLSVLDADSFEEEIALRGESLYARRLRRRDDSFLALTEQSPSEGALPERREKPGSHQVELEVLACSLQGDEAAAEPPIPGRGARVRLVVGRVVRTGNEVTDLRVGDLVHGVTQRPVFSHCALASDAVVALPESWRASQGVQLSELALARHALVDVAAAVAGARVWVLDAESAFGRACVQVARTLGASVVAVVDDSRPAAFPEGADLEVVHDTGSLDFVEALRLSGPPPDVILNTRAEPARSKCLALLARGGTFVDVHERIEGGAELPLQLARGVRYAALEREALWLDSAVYPALATRALELAEQAIDAEAPGAAPLEGAARIFEVQVSEAPTPPLVRADGSYLVTGGLAGFGLATAEWLVDQGAACVVLASRRGRADADATPVIERMRAAGARVECASLDVTDLDSVQALLDHVSAELPPLAGIFHSAVVLDDGPMSELDAASLARAMGAKALGAHNLYAATRGLTLDHFVLYSSVSALIGNPNQAAYAAANAYLDGLAGLAVREGRAVTSVSWGALGDVGLVARDAATEVHLQSLGIKAIPARRALEVLQTALRMGEPAVGVIDMQWDRWMSSWPATPWKRLEELSVADADGASGPVAALRSELSTLAPEARRDRLRDSVRAAASSVLRLRPDRLDDATSLRDYGIDSLMAVELQAELEDSIGVTVPSIELLAGVSVDSMTQRAMQAMEESSGRADGGSDLSGDQDLRAHFLGRICVQPPYFALTDIERDGDWVQARARPLQPGPDEAATVASAEAARHLAIAGSCAVSLQSPIAGKVYYPIMAAHFPGAGPHVVEGDGSPLESIRVRARCVQFDVRGSRARAETQLLDEDGHVLMALTVDYHVIPERQFATLFQAHVRPTDEASGHDPYASWRPLESWAAEEDGALCTSLGTVDPQQCLGHFVDYPALPVSVMMRSAIQLVAAGVRRHHGDETLRVELIAGTAETHAFIFAGEPASLTARQMHGGDGLGERWECEVAGPHGVAVRFELRVAVRAGAPSLGDEDAQRAAS